MPIQPNGNAPYAPPGVILGLIDRARARGLPTPVNKDVLLRTGVVTESLVPRSLQALQQLELINEDGTWTQNLEALRRAPEADFPARLAEVIRAVYADVFQYVDPSKNTATEVRDAFRAYIPHGQQDRMVTLFLGLCQRAGLVPPDAPAKAVTREPRAPLPRKAAPSYKTAATKVKTPQHQAINGLPAPLAGLLQTLPQAWTKQDRDRFLNAFAAMLDYSIPMRSEAELKEEEEESA